MECTTAGLRGWLGCTATWLRVDDRVRSKRNRVHLVRARKHVFPFTRINCKRPVELDLGKQTLMSHQLLTLQIWARSGSLHGE